MRSLIITEKDAGQRLDKLLGKYLNLAGKSFIYKYYLKWKKMRWFREVILWR